MPTPLNRHVTRVQAVFDDWARRGRAEGMEQSHGPVARRAFDRLPLDSDSWYLDIGCGNGYTVRWAAAVTRQGRAVGLDVAPEMIARARALSADASAAEFHCGTFPDHPLPPGRFDAVFSMEMFYYLPDVAAAVREVHALLAPGGRFACVVDYYKENAASHSWPDDLGVPMHLLDTAEWGDRFEAAGLTVVEQVRITLPPGEASEPWKAEVGSLLTLGEQR